MKIRYAFLILAMAAHSYAQVSHCPEKLPDCSDEELVEEIQKAIFQENKKIIFDSLNLLIERESVEGLAQLSEICSKGESPFFCQALMDYADENNLRIIESDIEEQLAESLNIKTPVNLDDYQSFSHKLKLELDNIEWGDQKLLPLSDLFQQLNIGESKKKYTEYIISSLWMQQLKWTERERNLTKLILKDKTLPPEFKSYFFKKSPGIRSFSEEFLKEVLNLSSESVYLEFERRFEQGTLSSETTQQLASHIIQVIESGEASLESKKSIIFSIDTMEVRIFLRSKAFEKNELNKEIIDHLVNRLQDLTTQEILYAQIGANISNLPRVNRILDLIPMSERKFSLLIDLVEKEPRLENQLEMMFSWAEKSGKDLLPYYESGSIPVNIKLNLLTKFAYQALPGHKPIFINFLTSPEINSDYQQEFLRTLASRKNQVVIESMIVAVESGKLSAPKVIILLEHLGGLYPAEKVRKVLDEIYHEDFSLDILVFISQHGHSDLWPVFEKALNGLSVREGQEKITNALKKSSSLMTVIYEFLIRKPVYIDNTILTSFLNFRNDKARAYFKNLLPLTGLAYQDQGFDKWFISKGERADLEFIKDWISELEEEDPLRKVLNTTATKLENNRIREIQDEVNETVYLGDKILQGQCSISMVKKYLSLLRGYASKEKSFEPTSLWTSLSPTSLLSKVIELESQLPFIRYKTNEDFGDFIKDHFYPDISAILGELEITELDFDYSFLTSPFIGMKILHMFHDLNKPLPQIDYRRELQERLTSSPKNDSLNDLVGHTLNFLGARHLLAMNKGDLGDEWALRESLKVIVCQVYLSGWKKCDGTQDITSNTEIVSGIGDSAPHYSILFDKIKSKVGIFSCPIPHRQCDIIVKKSFNFGPFALIEGVLRENSDRSQGMMPKIRLFANEIKDLMIINSVRVNQVPPRRVPNGADARPSLWSSYIETVEWCKQRVKFGFGSICVDHDSKQVTRWSLSQVAVGGKDGKTGYPGHSSADIEIQNSGQARHVSTPILIFNNAGQGGKGSFGGRGVKDDEKAGGQWINGGIGGHGGLGGEAYDLSLFGPFYDVGFYAFGGRGGDAGLRENYPKQYDYIYSREEKEDEDDKVNLTPRPGNQGRSGQLRRHP